MSLWVCVPHTGRTGEPSTLLQQLDTAPRGNIAGGCDTFATTKARASSSASPCNVTGALARARIRLDRSAVARRPISPRPPPPAGLLCFRPIVVRTFVDCCLTSDRAKSPLRPWRPQWHRDRTPLPRYCSLSFPVPGAPHCCTSQPVFCPPGLHTDLAAGADTFSMTAPIGPGCTKYSSW